MTPKSAHLIDLICSLRISSEFGVGISSLIALLQELKSIAVKINCEIFFIILIFNLFMMMIFKI